MCNDVYNPCCTKALADCIEQSEKRKIAFRFERIEASKSNSSLALNHCWAFNIFHLTDQLSAYNPVSNGMPQSNRTHFVLIGYFPFLIDMGFSVCLSLSFGTSLVRYIRFQHGILINASSLSIKQNVYVYSNRAFRSNASAFQRVVH